MSSGESSRRQTAGKRPVDEARAAPLIAAVRAAPGFGLAVRWRLRLLADGSGGLDRAELHAMPSRCPMTDPIGRGRAIAGGAALRNLELAVAGLGHRPVVRLLPDDDDPLHLATVLADADDQPDPADQRLHQAIPKLHCHYWPFAARPVPPALQARLYRAACQGGGRALPVEDEALRSVGTVLATAASRRCEGEDQLADVARWLAEDAAATSPPAVLIDQLGRGALLLITTASDQPSEWLRAGWAVQNAWLTATDRGLAASVVGGVLDAPGVRAALAVRLRLDGCPQLLLRAGWARADVR